MTAELPGLTFLSWKKELLVETVVDRVRVVMSEFSSFSENVDGDVVLESEGDSFSSSSTSESGSDSSSMGNVFLWSRMSRLMKLNTSWSISVSEYSILSTGSIGVSGSAGESDGVL